MQVLLIPADVNVKAKVVELSKKNRLEAMQKLVGGFIESAPCPDDNIAIYCNEEGKINNLWVNAKANIFWESLWKGPLSDVLVGDVIVTGGVDEEGEQKPVTSDVLKMFNIE